MQTEGVHKMTTYISTPIKETFPTLYGNHVIHFCRAKAFTYNYYPMDEVVKDNYSSMTAKKIAVMLREPVGRIRYRVRILQALKIIVKKNFYPTSRGWTVRLQEGLLELDTARAVA
jgi:hypothetical protein